MEAKYDEINTNQDTDGAENQRAPNNNTICPANERFSCERAKHERDRVRINDDRGYSREIDFFPVGKNKLPRVQQNTAITGDSGFKIPSNSGAVSLDRRQ